MPSNANVVEEHDYAVLGYAPTQTPREDAHIVPLRGDQLAQAADRLMARLWCPVSLWGV